MNIPTPTTSTHTRKSGDTVQITEWTLGAYTLRKEYEPGYTDWIVFNTDRDLPRIEDHAGFNQSHDFGVSCFSNAGMTPSEAAAYASQIMEAAQVALTFNMIVAAS